MNTDCNQALTWLQVFKSVWLPQNISTDNHLLESLTNKLDELEELLMGNDSELLI